jgi:hypothetical protein
MRWCGDLPLTIQDFFLGLFVLPVFPVTVTPPAPGLALVRGLPAINGAAMEKGRAAFVPERLIHPPPLPHVDRPIKPGHWPSPGLLLDVVSSRRSESATLAMTVLFIGVVP